MTHTRFFRISIVFAVALLAGVAAVKAATARAAVPPQSKTVWDGVYTEQQAARGSATFAGTCSRCHAADANGGDEGKNLAGKAFWDSFRESTVDRLLDY